MSPTLAIVANNTLTADGRAESLSERGCRLQTEARTLAREHILALQGALISLENLASDIAQGGEAYPAGVRDVARRLADDCGARALTLEAITKRA